MNSLPPLSRVLLALGLFGAGLPALAQTSLSDQPVFTAVQVPGNLALALSVEFPTALGVPYTSNYNSASEYLGYFDPKKCYQYNYSGGTTPSGYFSPYSAATATHTCTSSWSGNFLNWATMQTIDPFRWVLTGGFRSVDTATTTILERAWASGQGGTAPDRTASGSNLTGATPTGWTTLNVHVSGMQNKFRINGTTINNLTDGSNSGNMTGNVPVPGTGPQALVNFEIFARVKVCDPSLGTALLESNCKAYGSNYKPEGLVQQYADRIRFSAFGYLNDATLTRDAGVMRARMKFVGPTKPVPGSTPIANGVAEWSSTDGTMMQNPDPLDASATNSSYGLTGASLIVDSGVMNYLNKFGESSHIYKTYDPVSELYYAVQRYYRNIGNVPEWTNISSSAATLVDGFPVITSWDDPILYSCQKNFILGIGDVNTHADRNLPGSTSRASEPSMPAAVSSDTAVNAETWTSYIGAMIGDSNILRYNYGGCCNNNGTLMAGLAYWANSRDIRPDLADKQTIQTYYLDVLESGFETNNQFYLAAKYGGAVLPDSFDPTTRGSTDLPTSWWHTNTDQFSSSQLRPDNYYTADQPNKMRDGLVAAFADIATKLSAFTSSFATATAQVSSSGLSSYSTQYDGKTWMGELTASQATLSNDLSAPTLVQSWTFSSTLGTQLTGSGWDNKRQVVTYDTAGKRGVPFRTGGTNIPAAQLALLDTSYVSGDDSSNYLNYLRGDRSLEQPSTPTSGNTNPYRNRAALLGDIVNGKALPVAAPSSSYTDAFNPGYSTFKSNNVNRITQVFAGANDGMLHAIDGTTGTTSSLSGSSPGKELFAYIPGVLFAGPTAPNTDGLAALGNPSFVHHYYVDSTPASGDVDFNYTGGVRGTSQDWRTILVGGLGKGGKAYYALDVTTPAQYTSETAVAGKVLWEYSNGTVSNGAIVNFATTNFTENSLGFSYGQPTIVKTKKYGWVVLIGSGHNNTGGVGALLILNPKTGALLEKISTGVGTASSPAGLTEVQPYVQDFTDGTVDAVYGGDLLGNLWRFDLTATSGAYPAPTQLAQFKDASGTAQAVTTRPLIMIQPGTNRRFVLTGTGRALATSDIASTQVQTFYAIVDGSAAAMAPANRFPTGGVLRSNLQQLVDLTQPTRVDFAAKYGWYVDLGNVGETSNWRVLNDPTSNYTSVVFATTQPTSSGDACKPAGTSRVYAIDLGTGQSQLLNVNNTVAYLGVTGVVTDITVIGRSDLGKSDVYIGTNSGSINKASIPPPRAIPPTQMNWREVPIAN